MPDEEVVVLAREGSHDAAEFLLSRYRTLVETKAKAYFVVGADREDVVQEGMIGLCKAIRDFRLEPARKFRPFAELCVTRQIITAVKTATRHKHTLLNGSISLDQGFSDDSTEGSLFDIITDRAHANPEEALLGEQLPSSIQQLIAESLSDLERGVLQSYLDGKSYQEIGAELKCRTKAIDNALQRVKKKIGTLLTA